MITLKPNPFQSVNGEEEKEVKCGWHLSEWRVMRGNWWWFFCIVLILFLSLFMVLYWMYLFDFDFSGEYVIKLFGKWIATHRLSKCKSPHHDYHGIRFLRWKDNWFWSHHLQWNISCTLWVSWIHRMGWITANVIGTMDCKERQE